MSASTTIAPQGPVVKVSPLIPLGAKFNIDPAKLVNVLRGTVIKPNKNGKEATDEEVAAFCIVANQYGLNPFTREIHAFVSGEKGVVPIVGVDGWVKIVNESGKFDGCEFEEIPNTDGTPNSITCTMHIKGQDHPIKATERFQECYRDTGPWKTMPWRMLRHKAYMQAARYAFGFAGIYDEDEAADIVQVTPTLREPVPMPRAIGEAPKPQTVPEVNGQAGAVGRADEETIDNLRERIRQLELNDKDIAKLFKDGKCDDWCVNDGKIDFGTLSEEQANDLSKRLARLEAATAKA